MATQPIFLCKFYKNKKIAEKSEKNGTSGRWNKVKEKQNFFGGTHMFEQKTLDVIYDFDMDEEEKEPEESELSSADALIKSINKTARVNLDYMSRISGKSKETLVRDLAGTAIFQNPAVFENRDEWNIDEGWLLSSQYLCGNIPVKYDIAERADIMFPGCFTRNKAALMKVMPGKIDASEIHFALGPTWIPSEIYEEFIVYLLKFQMADVSVTYNSELEAWRVELPPAYTKRSVLNNYTYGTSRMSAVKIIENTLNSKTVKVFDYDYSNNGRGVITCQATPNRQETLLAQEKQEAIIREFDKWVHSDGDRLNYLRDCYNDKLVGYAYTPYDGSFLELPGLNGNVKLYDYQKNAVARMLLSEGNILFCHEVGSGKTYIIICGVHELYRTGLSDKNLVVVPNNVLRSTAKMHKELYPNDKILVVYPTDFKPDNRNKILEKIRDNNYVAVYMAFSSFDMLGMSKKYWENKQQDRISELARAAANTADKAQKKMLESEIKALKKKLDKFIQDFKETKWLTYESLGIKTLIVDEAHNYKNIPIKSRTDNIVGLHTTSSKKSKEMLEKVHNTPRTIFTTGTPITNSLTDLYVLQKYLQENELKFRDVDSLDAWVNSFAEREVNPEVDIDGSHIRFVTRYSVYHNIPELMAMFSQVCDFYSVDNKDGLPLYKGYTDVVVPRSEWQKLYIEDLAARLDRVRLRLVDKTEDNLLKITTDGRLCALDIRLVDKDLWDDKNPETTKTDACSDKILDIYNRYPGTCQIVFSDVGTPKDSFNVYDDIKEKLVKKGIPEHEIAFVHDAASEKARARLFDAMNEGRIRVCIGSTARIGIGTNVQKKLVAIHHLSIPWRPAEVIQREGRILRQNNSCEEVFVFRYITESSFDAYSWQILEKKARFVESFLSGTAKSRSVDDVGNMVLQCAEIKALAIGNALVKKRVETNNRLERAKIAFRSRQKELLDLREVIDCTPTYIASYDRLIASAEKDKDYYEKTKKSIPNEERVAFGTELLKVLKSHSGVRQHFSYQGFTVIPSMGITDGTPFVYVKSPNNGKYRVEMDGDKPIGCSKRIDYVLDHLGDRIKKLKADKLQTIKRREEAEADYDKGNSQSKVIEGLMKELAEIDDQLNEMEEEALSL